MIDTLLEVFVPSENFFKDNFDKFMLNFAFIDDIKEIFDYIMSKLNTSVKPVINMDLSVSDSKYNYGTSATVLSFDWYEKYKPFGDTVIIGFSYIFFFLRLYRRLPEIIGGTGAIVEEIEAHKGKPIVVKTSSSTGLRKWGE